MPPPPDRPSNRRTGRLILPACPHCGSYEAAVERRADYVLYLRCPRCRLLWTVAKPAFDPDAGDEPPA